MGIRKTGWLDGLCMGLKVAEDVSAPSEQLSVELPVSKNKFYLVLTQVT